MADGTETGNEVVKDVEVAEVKTADDEGSLASIMEEMPRAVFTGHPALGEVAGDETGPENESEKPPETTPPVKEESTEAPKPPEKEEKKFKHASWEETETARIEAEKKMHSSTEEAANLRKEKEDLQRRLAEKEAASPPEKPAEQVKPPTKEERKGKIKQALETIQSLDATDPDYQEKVAEAWAEAGFGAQGTPLPDMKEIAKEAAKIAREEIQAEQNAKEAERAAERQKEENARTWDKAVEMAGKAGLDMEIGSADYRLFQSVAQESPAEIKDKPFAEQVNWAAGEVRRLTGKVAQTQEEREAAARRTQEANAVLERGATKPSKKAPEQKPYTLGSILEKNREARVI